MTSSKEHEAITYEIINNHGLNELNTKLKHKNTIIFLLVLITITSSVTAYSFQYLLKHFDNHCVVHSHIKFINKSSNATERYKDVIPAGNSTILEYLQELFKNDANLRLKELHDYKINDKSTLWGKMMPCDFMVYTPIMLAIFCLIWSGLFVMCGKGGNQNATMLPRPWRIVMPAIIFFLINMIISMIHVIYLHIYLEEFCNELHTKLLEKAPALLHSELSCPTLLDEFAFSKQQISGLPSLYFNLAKYFAIFSHILCDLLLLFMIYRCAMGSDFEVVGIKMRKINAKEYQHPPQEKCGLCSHDIQVKILRATQEIDENTLK